jgi:hypothetical protein
VEVVIDGLGEGGADAVDLLEVGEAGFGDAAGGAEGVEEGFFAFGADAGQVVEGGSADVLGSAGAVTADGKAVGFVAEAL